MDSMYDFMETSRSNFLSNKHLGVLNVPSVRIWLKFKRSRVHILVEEYSLISNMNRGRNKTHPLVPTAE